MADKVTFDFDTGEIIFDTPGQNGIEVDPNLLEKRETNMEIDKRDQSTDTESE